MSDTDGEGDLGGGERGVERGDGEEVQGGWLVRHGGGGQGGRAVNLNQLTGNNLRFGHITQRKC